MLKPGYQVVQNTGIQGYRLKLNYQANGLSYPVP